MDENGAIGRTCSSTTVCLTDLIKELHLIFESDYVNIEQVHELMSSYKSNRKDWEQYAIFDENSKYTKNLVDSGNGKFNLLTVCWNDGQGSSIHDHSDSHCFMKTLHGELREVRFAWPSESSKDWNTSETLEEVGRVQMPLNSVSYMNDSLGLHLVENANPSEKAISLHLYCPPYDQCYTFDQATGNKALCNLTFWTKYGEKTSC